MVRTAIVTAIAICLTFLLLGTGMFVVLRTTDLGKVMMGKSEGIADPWDTFMAGQHFLFLYLLLPITLLISFLTAMFTRSYSAVAGILGTAPIWGTLLAAGDLLRGFILVVSATVVALCPTWWRKSRAGKASSNALAAKHSN